MKKIGFACLCVILLTVLLLSGCGNTTPTQQQPDPTPTTPTDQPDTPIDQPDTPNDQPDTPNDQPDTPPEPDEPELISVIFMDRGQQVGETLSLNSGTILDPVDYLISFNEEYRYTFLGWDADDDGTPEEFPYTLQSDTVFTAVLDIEHIVYHYNIYVRDELVSSVDGYYGDPIVYPEVSSCVTETVTDIFLGWKFDGVFNNMILNYLTSDIEITAYFAESQLLKFFYDGRIIGAYLPAGEQLPKDLSEWMISAPDGYKIVWYTDEAYRSMLDTDTMIEGNLTLYGRNEPADTVSYVRAEDPETLLSAYNDALLARQTTMQIFADYAYGTAQDLVNYFSQNALTLYTYDISINSFDQYNMTILISYSPIANSKTDTVLYTQLPSSNQTVRGSNRPADFDDFAINLVEPAYTVNNSEALYYVLENGMRPIIDENSPELADLYEKMKAVLRTCVDDDMSEAEKARAIYEYLILNTVYDGALFNAAQENHSALENNSFYLEGVFNDHLAVCDGISKAYLCLCRMEGLECVRINGKKAPDDLAHAWNKVRVDGNWYIVDATSGGLITGSEEILSYKYFMITDEENEILCHPDPGVYSDLVCNTEYNVYEDLNALAYDADEAAALLKDYIEHAPEGRSTYELCLNYPISSDDEAIQDVLDRLNMELEIAHLGTEGIYCFILEK